jgi:hypothetical protein
VIRELATNQNYQRDMKLWVIHWRRKLSSRTLLLTLTRFRRSLGKRSAELFLGGSKMIFMFSIGKAWFEPVERNVEKLSLEFL